MILKILKGIISAPLAAFIELNNFGKIMVIVIIILILWYVNQNREIKRFRKP